MPSPYLWQDADLILSIYVQPRASRSAFSGIHGERFKLRIAAPPVDGQANAEVIRFLAKQFGVSKSRIHIISGNNSREKRVLVKSPARLPDIIEP